MRPTRKARTARNGHESLPALIVALMVLAAVVTATGLRPGATSIGPVLPEISAGLGLSATNAGILTALPGLCFALIGLTANRLTMHTGVAGSLLVASAFSTAGLLLRVFTDSWMSFLVLSAVALGGMAIGNVVLPAFIKTEFPRRASQMATAYATFLSVGATVPIVLGPALIASGDNWLGPDQGWRLALAIWAPVSAFALICWAALLIFVPHLRQRPSGKKGGSGKKGASQTALPHNQKRHGKNPGMPWQSGTAVALMFFFGLQSMQAYIQFGWVPAAFRDGGLSAEAAGWMGALIAIGGIPGGMLMPTVVARRKGLRPLILLFGVLLATGYIGIALAPLAAPWLWAFCLSISGFCFPTALVLIIERTRNPKMTAAVSGFVQPVGYLLAAAGPFLVGSMFGVVGSWRPVLILLSFTAIPLVWAGWVAARPRFVDDEVASHHAGAPKRLRGLPILDLSETGIGTNTKDEVDKILAGGKTRIITVLADTLRALRHLPKPGDQRLLVDSRGVAVATIQLVDVEVHALRNIPLSFSEDCGFLETGAEPTFVSARSGSTLDDRTEVLCQTFQLLEVLPAENWVKDARR